MLRIFLLILMLSSHSHAHNHGHAPLWQQASGWPDRIIVNPGKDATTSFSVTWRTASHVARSVIQLVPASADTRFDLAAQTYKAQMEVFNLEHMQTDAGLHHSSENSLLDSVHYHSFTFENLTPDTLYAYRVRGERGKWSEWLQTKTAATNGKLSFIYLGDSQNGVRSHWSRVIRQAYQTLPNADFFLHAGDLVSVGDSDLNWAEWFDAGGFIHRMTPAIPVRGNHENITVRNENGRKRVRTPFWRAQFTLPEEKNLSSSLQESNYMVNFADTMTLFVIDSSTKTFTEQVKWLDEALASDKAKWRVLTMHHPFFVADKFARNKTDIKRKAAFKQLLSRHRIDLVLTGHIHTYLRGERSQQTSRTADSITTASEIMGPVFVVSSSGAKNTNLDSDIDEYANDKNSLLQISRHAGNTPMYQAITIEGNSLNYRAYTGVGSQYDAFTLTKSAQGNLLTEGKAAFGEQRLFTNTGKYIDWYDLR
ncbi:FN3 domain-containing metallophosphoesterase family protein [Gayadomonas joobiniege]|uniref:FN3 domain-containing metallophosphoesterase family protein n=1 Tax=Gayadomonas joobiniege TaxID=1234606 RepID=UPI00036C2FF6|nr:FN3 domain-containing metallophosphoesterase family protein [Gayadomonas joobiniege]